MEKIIFLLLYSYVKAIIEAIVFITDKLLFVDEEFVLSLLGGELTLIALYFTLVPFLFDKKNTDYYLGYKLTDVYFYGDKDRNILKVWKNFVLIIFFSVITILLEWYFVALVLFLIFIGLLYNEIKKCLVLVVDDSSIRKEIEKSCLYLCDDDPYDAVQRLLGNEFCTIHQFNSIVDFLVKNKRYKIIDLYINRLIDGDFLNQKEVFFKIRDVLKDNKDINLDINDFKLYVFVRNSINDYSIEDYFDFFSIYINYNITKYCNDYERDNVTLLFIKAIKDSQMTNINKQYMINRIVSNLFFMYFELKNNMNKKDYYTYLFDIAKYFISKLDVNSFVNMLDQFDSQCGDNVIKMNFYVICSIYLFYLGWFEEEPYIKKEDKEVYLEMANKLIEYMDINNRIYDVGDYYELLPELFTMIEKMSFTWEKFENKLNSFEAKTCVVPLVVRIVYKSLIIMFYNTKIHRCSKSINLDVFAYDFEGVLLKRELKEKITSYLEMLKIKPLDELVSTFEQEYLMYSTDKLKQNEMLYFFDYTELEKVLKLDLDEFKKVLLNNHLFNRGESQNILKQKWHSNLSLDYFNYLKGKNIFSSIKLQSYIEEYILERMVSLINNERDFNYHCKKDEYLNTLYTLPEKYIHIKSSYDRLKYLFSDKKEYETLLKKYQTIDVANNKYRIFVENFNCNIKEMNFTLEPIDSSYLDNLKMKYFIKDDEYCIQTREGIPLIFNKVEIEEYLNNTHIKIVVEIEVSLDVSGVNNVVYKYSKENS